MTLLAERDELKRIMSANTKRRWFRFSLRTLFVVVTVVACWLGWNVHQVQKRKALFQEFVAEHQARLRVFKKVGDWGGSVSWHSETIQQAPATPTPIPLIQRLLGDEAHTIIHRSREADARRTMRYFPEATIIYYTGPSGPAWVRAIIEEAFNGGAPPSALPSP